MKKLIEKFIANPTVTNAAALVRYLDKHPMAECMTTPEDRIIILNARNLSAKLPTHLLGGAIRAIEI